MASRMISSWDKFPDCCSSWGNNVLSFSTSAALMLVVSKCSRWLMLMTSMMMMMFLVVKLLVKLWSSQQFNWNCRSPVNLRYLYQQNSSARDKMIGWLFYFWRLHLFWASHFSFLENDILRSQKIFLKKGNGIDIILFPETHPTFEGIEPFLNIESERGCSPSN